MWLLSVILDKLCEHGPIQTLPISLVRWSAKNAQIFKERNLKCNLNLKCTPQVDFWY